MSLVEYGTVAALVAIAAMVVGKTADAKITSTYDNIQSQIVAQAIGDKALQTPNGNNSGGDR
ncbi:MAG: hypothetical protein WA117_25280 [Verrucomicrobiia bacterium]